MALTHFEIHYIVRYAKRDSEKKADRIKRDEKKSCPTTSDERARGPLQK